MYYLMTVLGGSIGLDPLTFGMIVVMATAGTLVLNYTVHSNFLALLFYPVLVLTCLIANYASLGLGLTTPLTEPGDDLDVLAYISVDLFTTVATVTFVGMLAGLAGLLVLYRRYGHIF
ncbi:MAG: hypothetical protein ACR2O4_00415 [Hyphomicrobiaceae bacterium]